MNLEDENAPLSPAAALFPGWRALSARGVALAYLLLGALTLSPLLFVRIPALIDYPNHLARMWVLVHGRDIPALAANYVAEWRILPDLAMDLVVPALAQAMGVETAGRVFVALTMLLLVAGTAALHRALHGRVGLWPLCAWLFVYNAALAWGFLNCLFGIGLCLLALAGWIASRDWPAVPRLALFSLAACALFLAHLFAFGLYGLVVASYELGLRWSERRFSRASLLALCAAGAQFLPGLGLWLMSLKTNGPSFTVYGDLATKTYAAVAPFVFGPAALVFDRVLLLFCIAFWVIGRLTRAITLAPAMQLPLLVMLAAALAMPNVLAGSWAADIRLPVAIVFILIASARLDAARFPVLGLFALAALGFLGLRVWTVGETWRQDDARMAEFRAADQAIAPGARLLVVESPIPETERAFAGVSPMLAQRSQLRLSHMPALAVIDRAVFLPYLFSGWTTITPTARQAGLFETSAPPLDPESLAHVHDPDSRFSKPNIFGHLPYWRDWQRDFDYLLWVDFGAGLEPPADAKLETAATGSFFTLYRIVKP